MEAEKQLTTLDYADLLDAGFADGHDGDIAAELRRLHARVADLEDHITTLTTWKKEDSLEVRGWEVMVEQERRIVELEAEAVEASHRLAEANLRAAQMESQHKQAAEIATAVTKELAAKSEKIQELEGLLASVGAGGVSAQRVTQAQTLKASSDWLIDGGLLYRLNDEGTNCDEINVTMAGGLRTEAARVERAGEILNMLKAVQQAEDHIEQPIEMVAAPAELNLDGYYCKGCGRIGEIEELSAQDKAELRKLGGKPKTAAAPMVLPEPVAAQVRKVMLAINEEQLKKAKSHNTYIVGVIADKIEDGTLFDSGIYRRREIAEIVRNLLSTVTEFQAAAQEPFGYFKAEPFGWRDCAETDEGAIALYEAPQPQADARDAERYRFLRSRDLETVNNGGVFAGVTPDNIVLNGTDLDAEIDAAIAAAKGKSK